MTKDEIFICQHKKACGEEAAKKMLETLKKKQPDVKAATKVFINVYGEEVHVNPAPSMPLVKAETLAEKIARFDRLSAVVASNRSLLQEMAESGFFDDDEEDIMAEKEMEDVEEVDDFGEHFVVKSQPKMSFAEPKEGAKGATDNVGNDSIIADDESVQESLADKPSDMVEQ